MQIKIASFLFFLSLLFIKLPPFYPEKKKKNSLLTSTSFARFILIGLFGYFLFIYFKKGKKIFQEQHIILFVFFLLFFFFQSVSIVGAKNIPAFFQSYKHLIFPGILLVIIAAIRPNLQLVFRIFVISALFNFFYQMFMFFSPDVFRKIAEIFIFQDHLDLIKINLQRSRLYIETYDEILIPFIFILLQDKRIPKIMVYGLFGIVVIPSLLSNFRTRLLMLIFAFFASLFFISNIRLSAKITLLTVFVGLLILGSVIGGRIIGFSFVDRVFLGSEGEDVQTVSHRFSNIKGSLEIAKAHPFSGVGLGNYYEYIEQAKKKSFSLFQWKNKEANIALTNPHNIFAQIAAETGLVSLFFYFFMLAYFAVYDFKILFLKKDDFTKGCIISFWTLFLYSLFNPATTFGYNALFWGLRGMVNNSPIVSSSRKRGSSLK